MATLKELIEQKDALERQIREAENVGKVEALAEIRVLMAAYGLTAADLAATNSRKSTKAAGSPSSRPVAPKFRHPESGAQWTGRGLKPRWLTEELAKGKSLQDFAI